MLKAALVTHRERRHAARPSGGPLSHFVTAPLAGEPLGLAQIIRSSVRPLPRCRGGCPHPPSRRQARNGGEARLARQPTFLRTAAQGRAGRPPLQASRSVTQPHNAGQAPVSSPGGKFKAIAQREGSHCQRRHAAALSPGTARRHFAIAKPPKVLYNRLPDFLVNCQLLNIRRSGTNT